MPAKSLPPIHDIRKNLSYDPATGVLTRIKSGKRVASCKNGYIRFRIINQIVMAHRIAWALHYGELPPPDMEIDHINGIRQDNRIVNLRLVSMRQNMRNKTQYRNNTHGYPGIVFEAGSRRVKQWRAQIQVDGKLMKLGSYMCKTAAIFARKRAEIKYGFSQLAGESKWQLCTK
jgi:hypothetical protein